jgi:hypothetical protein
MRPATRTGVDIVYGRETFYVDSEFGRNYYWFTVERGEVTMDGYLHGATD